MTQRAPRSSTQIADLLATPPDATGYQPNDQSPIARAARAVARGDVVFQCELDLMNQDPVVLPLSTARTRRTTTDPSEIINAVCRQGWEIVTASFVFVHEGSTSREKLLSTGEQVAVQGRTVGYYLFRRAEATSSISATAGSMAQTDQERPLDADATESPRRRES